MILTVTLNPAVDNFYTVKKCDVKLGVTVVKAEHTQKYVVLSDGDIIYYDKLMIATGSRPFIPPMNGFETVENKFTFMSLDDAKALRASLTPDSRVFIIGAGLIGLKCAEGICGRTGEITVVDMADKILSSILDADGAAIVQKRLEANNIDIILNDCVSSFNKNTAILKSGRIIEFDILITAVGVRANTSLVSDAGGAVNRGIVTDTHCRTTLDNIYAAGDCAESYDISAAQNRVLALLPNAYMQGEAAGINMAGGEKLYDSAVPMNAISFFGLHIVTSGVYSGETYIAAGDGTYKKLFYGDNVLKGFIIIGDVSRTGIYTSLIRRQTPLDSIDFDLIKEKPQLMAFIKKDRLNMLGKECAK
jgi:NAD(P)H-nitrite reductase large subunit